MNLPTTHPAWARVVLELNVKGKNLKTVFTDQIAYGRVFADGKEQKTVFDFAATKVLEDTVLKPEETRVEYVYISNSERHPQRSMSKPH